MSDNEVKEITKRVVVTPPDGLREGLSARSFGLPMTFDAEKSTVEAVLSTEAPARVFDWERMEVVNEVLRMEGLRADLPVQVPLLDSHNRQSVDDQLGSILVNEVRDGQLLGTLRFAEGNEKADRVAKMVRQGHLTDVSIGYAVEKAEWIGDGESRAVMGTDYSGPLKVATQWRILEGSATPIGADGNAKVRNIENENPTSGEEKKEATMADKPEVREEIPVAEPVDVEALKREAAEAERKRANDITQIALLADCEDIGKQLVAEGKTVDEARAVLFEAGMKKRNDKPAFKPGEDDKPAKSKFDISDEVFKRSLCSPRVY